MGPGKHCDYLHPGIVMGERGPLSPRQFEAVLCTAEGLTSQETALVMGTTLRTANAHVEDSMNKLGAINRPHLISIAYCQGIIRSVGSITWSMMVINLLVGIALALSILSIDQNLLRPNRTLRGPTRIVRIRESV